MNWRGVLAIAGRGKGEPLTELQRAQAAGLVPIRAGGSDLSSGHSARDNRTELEQGVDRLIAWADREIVRWDSGVNTRGEELSEFDSGQAWMLKKVLKSLRELRLEGDGG